LLFCLVFDKPRHHVVLCPADGTVPKPLLPGQLSEHAERLYNPKSSTHQMGDIVSRQNLI
jgi:hypothetical protein